MNECLNKHGQKKEEIPGVKQHPDILGITCFAENINPYRKEESALI